MTAKRRSLFVFALLAVGADAPPLPSVLGFRVREVLLADTGLAGHNLGVTATGGTVRLWGAVPSAELATRAEELAKQLGGVADVVNELEVRIIAPPPGSWPRPLPLPLPAPTTIAEKVPAPPRLLLQPVTQVRPVGLTFAAPVVRREPSPAEAIEQLRRADARFAGLSVELTGEVAVIRGRVSDYADLWEFARGVNGVPGVTARVGVVERER